MFRLLRALSLAGFGAAAALGADARPNIVVIMADDMGYSDAGCYGGEIETPNLDGLAANGLRFTNFYNASRCCPTRAALLTGLYPHQAGVGRMTFNQGSPGYEGRLKPHAMTVAEALRAAGYSTAMVGKWHLSLTKRTPKNAAWVSHRLDLGRFSDPQTYPVGRGFQEHWGTIWGVVDFFDPFSLVHNTKPVESVPDGFYYTDAINDRAAEFVEKFGKLDRPFFLYVAHTAPHWPLHALPEDIAKYETAYAVGWDAIRESRYRRMVDRGLIAADTAVLSPRHDKERRWEDNPDKEWDARAMAVHAAMIDRLDSGLSRIVAKLKHIGEYENTLIFFLSDNGASPELPSRFGPGFDRPSHTRDGREIAYDTEKKVMPGPQLSYNGIGPMWANAANTPFRYWKKEQYEGGTATPFIVHWPAGLKTAPGAVTHRPGHVVDIMATALDVGKARVPPYFRGRATTPVAGESLVPIFQGRERGPERTIYFEHFGARGIRKGGWKLVSPAGKPWELYDLANDRTETRNLAGAEPGRVRQLAADFEAWAERAGVYPLPSRR